MSINQIEQYPVDENLKVIEGTNIYKNKKWWCAVLLVEAFGHKKVMVYLWQYKEKKVNQGGTWVGNGTFTWKIQQKMGINFQSNWNDEKVAIDKYMAMINGVVT
jgi:hypothetical protein